jgi:type II secretory ATPase GspE/PulE/Tfp pilus assembly ATPase PilB-like protein
MINAIPLAGEELKFLTISIQQELGLIKFRTAIDKRKTIGQSIHLLEVLHELGYLSFQAQVKLIYGLFSEYVEDLIVGNVSTVSIKSVDGAVRFFFQDDEVVPCFCPSMREHKKQMLLSYDDYLYIEKQSKNGAGEEKKISFSTFVFENIVHDAAIQGASDIHMIPKEDYYRVFFRMSGDLVEQEKYLMSVEDGFEFTKMMKLEATKFMKGSFNADKHTAPQEARIEYDGVDVRLQFIPDGTLGNKLTSIARVIRKTKVQKADLLSKGFYPNIIASIKDAGKRAGGLIVISGVTGSGKSTLLADILSDIDERKRIYTIEDPIEYILPGKNITQHQLYIPPSGEDGMGYSEFTKAAKRADPDVVSIGEMRNDPTLVKAIFEMANAGQLIYTTVHIRSAFELYHAFDKVFEIKYESIVPLVFMSINMKLSKRLCDKCKVPDKNNENAKAINAALKKLPFLYKTKAEEFVTEQDQHKTFLKAPAPKIGEAVCPHCGGKGYDGRVPMYEYFEPDVQMIEWILRETPTRYEIEQRASLKKLGQNRLSTFIARLIDGQIDTSPEIFNTIL